MHHWWPFVSNFLQYLPDKIRNRQSCPMKPLFYKRFVDDVINTRKKSKPDSLLISLNSYNSNIDFTVEVNPSKFLDTNI